MDDKVTNRKTILFLHGFASSGQSTKALYLGGRFKALPQVEYHAIDFNPTPRDFEYVTTTGLIDRLRQYVLDRQLGVVSIIGSSYGGLVAVHYARRFGGVERMLLLAPGLRWLSGGLSEEQLEAWKQAGAVPVSHGAFQEEIAVRYDLQVDGSRYLEPVPPVVPVTIIHGTSDVTVPTGDSRAYALQYPDKVQLIEVEADHDLNGHLGLIWDSVQSFLLRV
jgi:pimeloyl-ACP methyl ester carboxylesterase